MEVIAWITDDGPDGKKARRLLHHFYSWIIVSVCWAHQVNLMVGDYLKRNPSTMQVVSSANDVIRWFREHDLPREWLNHEQLIDHPHALLLILPADTRWMYHYLSITRLLDVSGALRTLCMRRADDLLGCAGREEEARARAEKVLGVVKDVEFWDQLRMCASGFLFVHSD